MFQWTEFSASCNNLSVAVTYEHADSASSSTHLQLIGGAERRENWESIVQIPSDSWYSRTQGLEPHHLGQHS
jgi:hypothetical protein